LFFIDLEALVSISMVGINSNGYFIVTREGILKLGTFTQPGIMGKMRQETGLNPKTRTNKVNIQAIEGGNKYIMHISGCEVYEIGLSSVKIPPPSLST